MRSVLQGIVLLCACTLVAGQAPAPSSAPLKQEAVPPAASLKCEPLLPWFRSDDSTTVTERIAPSGGLGPTGNSFFMMRRPVKYVVVHLTPTSSDVAPYAVKLITRYSDDSIYESIVETIHPTAGKALNWGPIPVMGPKIPAGKTADAFNVKVQENYTFEPRAKGFSYTVAVDGCN